MDRTINLGISQSELTKIAEAIGSWDKLWTAIGYLGTWNHEYPIAGIFKDSDTDLLCIYRDGNGRGQYVIGAVWHDDHYGFHS